MGTPFGFDKAVMLGLVWNFSAMFAIATPIAERLHLPLDWVGFACFLGVFCWMMFGIWLHNKLCERKGYYDLNLLYCLQLVPTAATCVILCFILVLSFIIR